MFKIRHLGRVALQFSEWDDKRHPRADGGRFASAAHEIAHHKAVIEHLHKKHDEAEEHISGKKKDVGPKPEKENEEGDEEKEPEPSPKPELTLSEIAKRAEGGLQRYRARLEKAATTLESATQDVRSGKVGVPLESFLPNDSAPAKANAELDRIKKIFKDVSDGSVYNQRTRTRYATNLKIILDGEFEPQDETDAQHSKRITKLENLTRKGRKVFTPEQIERFRAGGPLKRETYLKPDHPHHETALQRSSTIHDNRVHRQAYNAALDAMSAGHHVPVMIHGDSGGDPNTFAVYTTNFDAIVFNKQLQGEELEVSAEEAQKAGWLATANIAIHEIGHANHAKAYFEYLQPQKDHRDRSPAMIQTFSRTFGSRMMPYTTAKEV